ncbi:hypothetical protein PAMA_008408 [Pampus argenteus]
MDPEKCPRPGRRRRSRCVVAAVLLLLVAVIVAVSLALTLRQKTKQFHDTFLSRCEAFKGYDCQKVWTTFEQAYVGRDPCEVPVENYNPLIAAVPFKPACNRVMLWSKTKDVVQDFAEKTACYMTLEETLLGFVLDGLTWCGKEGSTETITTGCPDWSTCENNPVRSFWLKVSAALADSACGDVTAMLNGSIAAPFSPTSIFGSIEVKRLKSPRVTSLNIVLVRQQNNVANCTNASFKDLQKELDQGIKYSCKDVPMSQIEECGNSPEKPCGSCW